jgi:hypothetical protein
MPEAISSLSLGSRAGTSPGRALARAGNHDLELADGGGQFLLAVEVLGEGYDLHLSGQSWRPGSGLSDTEIAPSRTVPRNGSSRNPAEVNLGVVRRSAFVRRGGDVGGGNMIGGGTSVPGHLSVGATPC